MNTKPDQEPKPPTLVGNDLLEIIAEAERATVLAYRDLKPEKDARERRAAAMRDALAHLPDHARRVREGDETRPVKREDLVRRIKSEPLFNAVHAWAWGDGPLVISGPTGVGKSSAAAYLVRRLGAEGIAHGGEAYEKALLMRWQPAAELGAAERESDLGATPELIRVCQRARLLVLDELAEVPVERREPLRRVLWHRYDAGYPTITTTELSEAKVVSVFGEAFMRRLMETQGVKGRWVNAKPRPEEPERKLKPKNEHQENGKKR